MSDDTENFTFTKLNLLRRSSLTGVPISTTFDRKCTHLILFDLENDTALTPSRIDASANRKLQKAREWGKEVVSMREFRRQIAQLASEAEAGNVKEEPIRARKDKGKGKEVVEEVGKGVAEEESMRGVLSDCVVFFSTKSNVSLMFVFTRIYRKLIEETVACAFSSIDNISPISSKISVVLQLDNTAIRSLTSSTRILRKGELSNPTKTSNLRKRTVVSLFIRDGLKRCVSFPLQSPTLLYSL